MTRPVSDAALVLLKNFEQGPHGGFSPVIYHDDAGHATIGWGHKVQPGEHFQQPISAAEADKILRADVIGAMDCLDQVVTVPLTPSMTAALTCFVFNVGIGHFLGSTLRRVLNAHNYAAAADEFPKWNKGRDPKTGEKVAWAGLTRRRAAERELFLRDGLL